MGLKGVSSASILQNPKPWSSEGGMRRLNVLRRPMVLAFLLLVLFVTTSLFIHQSTYLRPFNLTFEADVVSSPPKGRPFLFQGCDLFTGSWVYDNTYPLYNNCSFAERGFRCSDNGRPDLQYRQWRWQPRDCDVPSISKAFKLPTEVPQGLQHQWIPPVLTLEECFFRWIRFNSLDMLRRMKNQRVAFVGDSMGRTQWESLVCLLMSAAPDQSLVKEVHGHSITKTTSYLAVWFPGFNVTVEYYRSPWLVRMSRPPRRAPRRVWATLKLDSLESVSTRWRRANILVFNSGHWWTSSKTYRSGCYFQVGSAIRLGMKVEAAYRIALATWAAWVKEQINTNITQVFFRNYEPSHWENTVCLDGSSPLFNESQLEHLSRYAQAEVLEDVWGTFDIQATFLNITQLSMYRPDAHIFNYSFDGPPMDCAHWCLPGVPDTWNELLYASLLLKANVTLTVPQE